MRSSMMVIDAAYHRPAIPVALALMAGIVLGDRLPGWPLAALACCIICTLHLLLCLRRCQSAWLSPLAALLAAGYLAMTPWRSPLYGPDHITRHMDGEYWRISATVAEPSRIHLGRTRTVVALKTLFRDERTLPVAGRIRLTIMGETDLVPGDRLGFASRLKPLRNFKNPGSYDFVGDMTARGIHGSAWVRSENLRREGVDAGYAFGRRLHGLRAYLDALIDRSGDSATPAARAVLKALVFGDRSGIDRDLRERFNRAGVGHLLAISGLHVGIVATVAFAVFRWCLSLIPAMLWRGWGRVWAAGATLMPVTAYAVLAGLSPSTQRAAIMVGVFLLAIIAGRSRETVNTVAVAALVILALFPPSLFTVAFQLSFAAVLAIVYGIEKTVSPAKDARPWPRRLAGRLVVFGWVSLLAIAGTVPVVLYHFNQTSVVGLAANLIAVPLAGFLAVPLGLTAALAALLSEGLAMVGFGIALRLLDIALMAVDHFASLTFAAVKTVTPSVVEICLYYTVGWCLFNLRRRPRVAWALALVLAVAAIDGLFWGYQRFWHTDLRVAAIDVGQGGATLLEMPGGGVVLVDGGGFSDNRRFDVGERIVAPFLWHRKIGRVDTLVLSHPNADHLNGLIYIARHFGVRELWTNGDANTTRGYLELMAVCREKGIAVRQMDTAAPPTRFGDAALAVLHPPPGFFDRAGDGRAGVDQDLRNAGSMVLKASLAETAFLITGDITVPAEQALVRREGARLATTVLFAPHHGSSTSSSTALIDAAKPDVVVISAGAGNRFGFPHAVVTDRYRAAGAAVLCTCTHGAVLMRTDGARLACRTRLGGRDGP